jgi:hypothetical protein
MQHFSKQLSNIDPGGSQAGIARRTAAAVLCTLNLYRTLKITTVLT